MDSRQDTRIKLLFPPCRDSKSYVLHVELLSDPGPSWLPNATKTQSAHPPAQGDQQAVGSAVVANQDFADTTEPPFFLAPNDRMLVAMLTLVDTEQPDKPPYSFRFTISASKLLGFLDREGPSSRTIPWTEWGPLTARVEPINSIWEGNWPVCVYGTRMITHNYVVYPPEAVDSDAETIDPSLALRYRSPEVSPSEYEFSELCVEIHDYNQAAIRQAVIDSDIVPAGMTLDEFLASKEPVEYDKVEPLHLPDGFDYYLHPTCLPPAFMKFFDDPTNVTTRLPYRVCRMEKLMYPDDTSFITSILDGTMITEDSVVLVLVCGSALWRIRRLTQERRQTMTTKEITLWSTYSNQTLEL